MNRRAQGPHQQETGASVKSMKTFSATLLLTIVFLSAGAFAGHSHRYDRHVAVPINANVTVIKKNQDWPKFLWNSSDSCAVNRCIDI